MFVHQQDGSQRSRSTKHKAGNQGIVSLTQLKSFVKTTKNLKGQKHQAQKAGFYRSACWMSEARLRCAAQILDKIENMWTYYYEEPLKVSMAWEKFLIFLTMCPLQADWNSSACVRVCVRAGERACGR